MTLSVAFAALGETASSPPARRRGPSGCAMRLLQLVRSHRGALLSECSLSSVRGAPYRQTQVTGRGPDVRTRRGQVCQLPGPHAAHCHTTDMSMVALRSFEHLASLRGFLYLAAISGPLVCSSGSPRSPGSGPRPAEIKFELVFSALTLLAPRVGSSGRDLFLR